jgi:peptidoglycan/LPS O-acetylase OafA/YrhL
MAAEIRGKSSARGGALDALRFLASAFIVLFHFGPEAPVPLSQIHEMFGRGYLATDFFLMLSGFVLASAYGGAVAGGAMRTGPFVAKRLKRIYPAHLITLAAMVALVAAASLAGRSPSHPEHFEWAALIPNLLLVHAWGYGGDTWNIPTWSLSALAACYVGFPILWRAIGRIRSWMACVVLFVATVVLTDIASIVILGHEEFDLPFRFGLVRAIPLFIAGLFLARICQTASISRRASFAIGALGLGAFVFEALTVAPDVLRIFATAAVMVACGQAVARPSRVVEWGGKLSFSLFITHTLAGLLWFDLLGPAAMRLSAGATWQWAVWGGSLAFALAMAAGFHHLIDQPIQRWLSRRDKRAPAPAMAAQAA